MKIVPIGSRHSDDIIRRFVASELRIPETDDEGFDKSAAKCEKDCPPGCDCECVCDGKEASSKAETAKEATACPNCGAHMQKTGNMERCACGYGQATQAARTAKAVKDTGVAEYYKKIYPDDYAKEMTSDGCVTPEAGKKVEYGHKPALKVSVRSLLGYTNDVNIPDKNPESGVSSGSGKTETPDPKWQSGDSANSVSGPERVESHGVGSSPKEQGKVDVPDLGVPGKQKAKNARMIVRAGEEAGKVNVRTRGKEKTEDMGTAEFVEKIRKLIAEKSPAL